MGYEGPSQQHTYRTLLDGALGNRRVSAWSLEVFRLRVYVIHLLGIFKLYRFL